MKRISALLCLCAAAGSAFAQTKLSHLKKVKEEWADAPVVHPVPPQYANEPAVILQQDVDLNYQFEGKGINVYYTLHRTVKVLDEKGIEWFNKIAIPVSSNTRVPLIKARTILPNGKVHDIPKEMIKVTRNEYGGNEIVFAMEAVEKNAEIELLVKEIRPLSFFGSVDFQFQVPVAEASFEMTYPKELVFAEKGYNGFPDGRDTLMNNRRHISVSMNDIPALHSEPNSFYDVHCMRAAYRIDHFIDQNDFDKTGAYTWSDFARRLHDEYYTIKDKERTAVNNYLTELGVQANGSETDNIRKIENGIKSGIVLYDDMDRDDAENLDSIITNKAATSSGYIKLFAACFTQAGVKHELGMTGNRHETRFDSEFTNWGDMEHDLFYFPGTGKFLAPTSVYYRYPVVPDMYLSNKGVFSAIPPKGAVTGPMYEVHTITPLAAGQTQGNIAAAVTLDEDMAAKVDISYAYSGYMATGLRRELLTTVKSKEKDIVKDVVNIADTKDNILNYTISNESMESAYGNKPLEITATVNTNDLIQKAGPKYLLKVGELIGTQKELYSDKDRKLPVDLDYPHAQNRTITINIPKGYKITNPDAVKMHSEYVDGNMKPTISFHSDYAYKADKVTGDKLIVTISETWSQIHFPAQDYERYRKVVNTAADFNKVTLLLEKKGGGATAKESKSKSKAVASK